ncbi:MAG: T9SS type A sorting domain-containing protein [Bacteroidales bacterium]|nr:T9SS type A sorting domain-containing protein [Bacteroidales bacterium]
MQKKIYLSSLLIFFSILVNAQTDIQIQWQKCFGGSELEEASSILQTSDGGYIFTGYTSSNDGDVSGNHGWQDAWVVKLDGLGDIEWQKCFGGSDLDSLNCIQQTSDGGYIISGSTLSTDGDVSGHHGSDYNADVWIVKLGISGEIEWQKCLGGSYNESASSIHQTNDGGYIITGFTESHDGDVSGHHGVSEFNTDTWIVKLDILGEIEWQKCLGGTRSEWAYSIQQTIDGGYIFNGNTTSVDGDLTGVMPGYSSTPYSWIVKMNESGNIEWQKCLGDNIFVFLLYSIQQTTDGGYILTGENADGCHLCGNDLPSTVWILRLDEYGNIEWQKCLGGEGFEAGLSIRQTSDGGYILSGWTDSNHVQVSGNHGNVDAWVVKLDELGDIEWQKCLGGSDFDLARYIRQTSDGGYILAGFTLSDDGDITGNHGTYDAWVVKLIGPNISGFVFHDENQNDLFDETEQAAAGHLIKLEPGPLFSFTNNEGMYYFKADEGDYTVKYMPVNYWFATTESELQFTVNQPNEIVDSLDFGVASKINTPDVAVYITGSSTRLGFDNHYWLNYKNCGTVTSSGTLNFKYDSDLTFITSEETPNSHVENLISWNYDPLGPGVHRSILLDFQVPTDIEYWGDTLFSHAWITPFVPDSCISNNADTIYQEITASLDPNDKTANPIGFFEQGYILHGQRLNYTIRFQNTGNDTAFTVIIIDTLDLTNMNIETFNVETFSHPVTWQLKNTNVMEFKFSNILLPDSTTNEPESHGFVRFSISPKPGLANNTVINNTAYIYFDYNLPVVTNTTVNTYINKIPGLSNMLSTSELIASVYPNPAKDELHLSFTEDGQKIICFTNMLGQNIYQTTTDKSQLTIDISEFERGMYFINVKCNHKSSYAKIVKD